MRSLISLCLRIGKPPLGHDRACSTEKVVPHSQLDGILLGGHPYLSAIASRKSPLCRVKGKAGKSFVTELARLYTAYVLASALESVALKAIVVLPLLLLQKPSKSSKNRDHMACIERRMPLWREGDLSELLQEGKAENTLKQVL